MDESIEIHVNELKMGYVNFRRILQDENCRLFLRFDLDNQSITR